MLCAGNTLLHQAAAAGAIHVSVTQPDPILPLHVPRLLRLITCLCPFWSVLVHSVLWCCCARCVAVGLCGGSLSAACTVCGFVGWNQRRPSQDEQQRAVCNGRRQKLEKFWQKGESSIAVLKCKGHSSESQILLVPVWYLQQLPLTG